jgi:hypothetical protein
MVFRWTSDAIGAINQGRKVDIVQIDEQIAAIEALSLESLRRRWRKHFRRDPPAGLPPKMIREAFIYALQESAFGGLSQAVRRRLDRLAQKIEENPEAQLVNDANLQPGSRLVRDWRGKQYEVEILENGFAFEGRVYSSLSEIARLITGARWSGPRFFGTNKASKP